MSAFAVSLIEPSATWAATFNSNCQKVARNGNGIVASYITSRNDAFSAQNRRFPVRDWLIGGALVLALVLMARPALAHDVYTGVRGHDQQLCCGGSDCEVAEFKVTHGGARFYSKRHGAWVSVPERLITYGLVPGSEAAGHWCGYKRTPLSAQAPVHGDDPEFGTYCAFLDPGSS